MPVADRLVHPSPGPTTVAGGAVAQVFPLDRLHGRRETRHDVTALFILEKVDEWGSVILEESTLTENVSLGGARVPARRGFKVGDLLTVREPGGGFEAPARVVSRSVGADGSRRLHLAFLGGRGPRYLIPA